MQYTQSHNIGFGPLPYGQPIGLEGVYTHHLLLLSQDTLPLRHRVLLGAGGNVEVLDQLGDIIVIQLASVLGAAHALHTLHHRSHLAQLVDLLQVVEREWGDGCERMGTTSVGVRVWMSGVSVGTMVGSVRAWVPLAV